MQAHDGVTTTTRERTPAARLRRAAGIVLLSVHVAVSAVVLYLIAVGLASALIRDGSNTNPTGLICGVLSTTLAALQSAPLLIALVTRRISPWWGVAHLLLCTTAASLTMAAFLFETPGPT